MHHRPLAWLYVLVMLAASISITQAQGSAPAAGQHPIFIPIVQRPGPASNGGGTLHSGQATYYDATGAGNCSFDATPNDLLVAAMNHTDYAASAICGAYVEVSGPKGVVTVRIVDQCPGCPVGNIDLSPQAFARIADLSEGVVSISWKIISPDISGPIRYHFKEHSNQWWTAVQIRNHRNPIAKFEYRDQSGQFKTVPRVDYNFFVDTSGMGVGPYTFRVTDSYGNLLTDSNIPLKLDGDVAGSGQFPKK